MPGRRASFYTHARPDSRSPTDGAYGFRRTRAERRGMRVDTERCGEVIVIGTRFGECDRDSLSLCF